MAVQIGATPDSGFDDPIGMLKDCHRRVERFLDILFRVARQAENRALTSEEQAAIEAALHYFGESGPRHTMDEEESLFPRLREIGADAVLEKVERLESDHGEAGVHHAAVERLYVKWIGESGLNADEQRRLQAMTEKLQQLYKAHIQIEEEFVFPFAAERLDRNVQAAMGSEFKARRETH